MSELKLQGFAERAEERMPLPDFAEIELQGRRLRRRRAVVTGAAVACVLAVAGVVALRDDSPRATEPIRPPDDAQVQAEEYPGPVMEDLPAGTYTMRPSLYPDYPVARITLPEGWNAWQGPNRFGPIEAGESNEEALDEITWYAGILIVRVDGVMSRPCQPPGSGDHVEETSESLVRAIRAIPGVRMTENVEPMTTFGYPAVHFRATPEVRAETCDVNFFRTTAHGVVGGLDGTADFWVVDVEGYPVLVVSSRTDEVPRTVRREQAAIVDSIEFAFED